MMIDAAALLFPIGTVSEASKSSAKRDVGDLTMTSEKADIAASLGAGGLAKS
jgi:hypothetical protein